MSDFSLKVKLNENNIQAPFQYKPAEDEFILNEISEDILLDSENVRVRSIEGQKLFCVDLGYSIDGEIDDMYFAIDRIKIYPSMLNSISELRTIEVKDNAIYFIDDTNFKSIAFLTKANFNKTLSFTIFTYASVFSSFMLDEIAKKLNALDTDFPVRNFYQNTKYKINDIIKKDGYLYRVIADFTSSNNLTNSIIITPFKRKEESELNMYDLVQDNNQFFIVNSKNQELKPLTSIISWQDSINKIYKNTIIIKNDNNKIKKYLVLNDILNPIWQSLIDNNDIIELYTAEDISYNNNDATTISEGLDLAFTKIQTVNNDLNNLENNFDAKLETKQDNLNAGENITLNDSFISVKVNNKYDINYKDFIFPLASLSYTIPKEISFKLSLNETNNENDFEASIKQDETTRQYNFKSTITIAENKETIILTVKDISFVELSQFFTPNTEYEFENYKLIFNYTNNNMTITIKPNVEGETFEAGEINLNYSFINIYNKNIFFITNHGYLTLTKDETSGTPRGSIVKFNLGFIINQAMIKKYETQIDYIELEIQNEIIEQYFNLINDFNIDSLKQTNEIYFTRTTINEATDENTEPTTTTTKTNAKFGLYKEENIYKFRIFREDNAEIMENDSIIISIYPEKNKELEYKETIAENLDNTLQSLVEKDKSIISDIELFKNTFEEFKNNLFNSIFPIGSIYTTSDDAFNPNSVFGGTWERVDNGRFLEAGDGTNGKTKRDAGLPNSSGTFGCLMVANARQSGAATLTGANRLTLGIQAGNNPVVSDTVQINLNNGNRIFGSSETVQPKSYVVNIWERTA